MGEQRLEDLMIINCESDIKIGVENVVDIFASKPEFLNKALRY